MADDIVTNLELKGLNGELDALVILRKLEMTREDYYKLMSIKNRLRDLLSDGNLDDEDREYCEYLIQQAYRYLNTMEDWHEKHNNQWLDK